MSTVLAHNGPKDFIYKIQGVSKVALLCIGAFVLLQELIPPVAAGTSYFATAPPNPSRASIGSNASFDWKFTFGENDEGSFIELIWGTKVYDNQKSIQMKLLTITSEGELIPNINLGRSLGDRVHWTGNLRNRRATFVLSDVHMSDEKLYACELDLGMSTHNEPIVNVVQLIVTAPPMFKRKLQSLAINQGTNATLDCGLVSGKPKPQILWTKSGRMLQNSTQTTFTIKNMERKLAGTYQCTAINEAGTDSSSISVEYKPQKHKETVISWIGHTTKLECIVSLSTLTKLVWFKNGRYLERGTSVLMFVPKNASDFGNYTCQTLEKRSYQFTVKEIYVPDRPIDLKSTSGVEGFNITWSQPPVNLIKPLRDYTIIVKENGSDHNMTFHNINSNEFTAKDIKRDTLYVVYVEARNEAGYSLPADVSVRTLEVGCPDPPSIDSVANGQNYTFRWLPPFNGGSSIMFYTVYIWEMRPNKTKGEIFTFNTSETFYGHPFPPHKTFNVTVTSTNKYGESPHFGNIIPVITSAVVLPTTEVTDEIISSTGFKRRETPGQWTNKSSKLWLWILIAILIAVVLLIMLIWRRSSSCCYENSKKVNRQRRTANNRINMLLIEEPDVLQLTERASETIRVNGGSVTEEEMREDTESDEVELEEIANDHVDEENRNVCRPTAENREGEKDSASSGNQPNLEDKDRSESALERDVERSQSQFRLLNDEREPSHSADIPQWDFPPPLPYGPCELTRERLVIQRVIGEGAFGVVARGIALDLTETGGWMDVAIKMLKKNASRSDLKDLLSELQVMKTLKPHAHVVCLLACITKSEPICVVTEFLPYGDLLRFLRKKRGVHDDYYDINRLPETNLSSQQLMRFAWEVSDGMAYLSEKEIIHRDLAARNVLVGGDLTCKVTDFGMARDVHQKNIYTLKSNGRLPLKWTALESLMFGTYTTKSDVWSYGVLLFEIVTIGVYPYPDVVKTIHLPHQLQRGYRMPKPSHLDSEVYAIMLNCWDAIPESRPTFKDMCGTIKRLERHNQDYINLKAYNGSLYENLLEP